MKAPAQKMWLSDLSIRQPHLITMLMTAVIVVGSLFYSRMGLDLFPDVSLPIVAVRTVYPGANPSEVERAVSKPLEDAVASLNGVESVRSTSMDSVSIVIVEFKLDRDAKAAADDVRTRVGAIRNLLPLDAREPVIERFDPSAAPILNAAISDTSGASSPDQVRTLADDIVKPRLERVPGVASVAITGGLVREVHVDVQRDRLEAAGVALQQVLQAIRGENLDVPGGRIDDGTREQLLKTAGKFSSLEQVGEVNVPTSRGNVKIRDLATVTDDYAEVRALRRLDGNDAVVATVQKQSGTNTVAVAEAVKHAISALRVEYPNLSVAVTTDQSEFTKEAVDDVQVSMMLGGLLAALVVFAFFRDWRNTLVTVIGLPIIVIGTFAVMHLLGMGLNMLTLMGLSLSIGMLIDDAIVVRENIFRHMEAGEEPKVAAQRGTAEIALAVVAVSSTIVAVFLPIAFTGGIVGKFLRDFGLTVAIAVLLSLVEAFTLAPMLSAYFFKRMAPREAAAHKAGRMERALNGLDAGYRRLLAWALRRRGLVMVVGFAAFFASLGVVPFMTRAFAPESDQGTFGLTIELPPGSRLQDTDTVVRHVEAVLLKWPDVVDVFTTVGSDDGAVEKATLSVKLATKGHGSTQRTLSAVRPELLIAAGSGAKLTTQTASTASMMGGGSVIGSLTSRPVLFAVQGSDAAALDTASVQVMEAIRQVPGAVDVDRSIKPGKPGLELVVDRGRAADLGLTTAQVGSTVRSLVNGERAGAYQAGAKDVDVIVRLQRADRDAMADVLRVPMLTPRGAQVPLSQVATTRPATDPAVIERQNRQRQVIVGASNLGRDVGSVVADSEAAVKRLQLPAGITVQPSGQAKYTNDAFSSLGLALGLSVLFVYMILCAQFASFLHPLTIMLALPFSIIGALLAIFATGKPIDMMGMIGIILLMGLVTKNSILLVDFTNQLKRAGRSTREALLEAGPVRLRPILMTTLAMIFGMLPLAAGIGAGAELRQPMGISVVGGLLTSTVLTLVVVPVAYSLLDDAVVWVQRRRRKGGTQSAPPESPEPPAGRPAHVAPTSTAPALA